MERACPADAEEVVALEDGNAHLFKLGGDALQMLRDDVVDDDFATGCSDGRHKSACFDLIGDNRIGAAVQLFHTADFDDVRSGAADDRAHGV